MCGIAGFSLSPNETLINSRALAAELLLGIEHRGHDATGAAWLPHRDATTPTIQKLNTPARQFVKQLSLARASHLAILHTRAATKGSPADNRNNHPIRYDHITGVHNGMLYNDDHLFDEMGIRRNAEVDSEAAFAALAWGHQFATDGQPYLHKCKTVTDVLEEVEGSAALAWLDDCYVGVLHLARVSSSPLYVAETVAGSLLFASESETIIDAAHVAGVNLDGRPEPIDEGTYIAVRDGEMLFSETFFPSWGYGSYSPTSQYARAGSGASGTTVKSPPTSSTSAIVLPEHHVDTRLCNPLVMVDTLGIWKQYNKRFDLIDEQHQSMVTDSDNHALHKRAHAGLLPGDYVVTTLDGRKVPAQIIDMPNNYPATDEWWTLRCFISYKGTSECAIVQRRCDEFEEVRGGDRNNGKAREAAALAASTSTTSTWEVRSLATP